MNKLTPIITQYVTQTNLLFIIDYYKKNDNLKYNKNVEISIWRNKIDEYYGNDTVYDYILNACELLFIATGTYLKLNRNVFTNFPEKTDFVEDADSVLQYILIDCFTRMLNIDVPEAKLFSIFTDCFTVIVQKNSLPKKTILKKITSILKNNKINKEQIKKELQSCAAI